MAFYEALGGGRYRASEHTIGPWSDKAQHLGPPSALLVREAERCSPREGTAIRRVSIDVLGPVPVDEIEVRAEVVRPGRSVELVSAELGSGGRVAATARVWRSVLGDTTGIATATAEKAEPGLLPSTPVVDGWATGYAAAMDWRRSTSGTIWARQRVPLVVDEEPTALQRLLAVADSASGVSSPLSFDEWSFANTDLTVHLHRTPTGAWIGMDAESVLGPDGAAVATSVLRDASGRVGRGEQTLFVSPR